GDDGNILSRSFYVGFAQLDIVFFFRNFRLIAVGGFALHKDDRVFFVADGLFEQAFGVIAVAGGDDLYTRNIGIIAFKSGGVVGAELARRAGRSAENEGTADLAAAHRQHFGGGIEDLVERQDGKVPGHELDDGAQTVL